MHRYSKPILVAEPVFGSVRETRRLLVHDRAQCKGEHCPLHNPSRHHMRAWTKVVRLDKLALVERVCKHGTGHPDPDSLAYLNRALGERAENYALGMHGCDGCCHE